MPMFTSILVQYKSEICGSVKMGIAVGMVASAISNCYNNQWLQWNLQ